MKLIVGLGNPGKKYAHTRHNVGFLVVDQLSKKEEVHSKEQHEAEIIKTTLEEKRILLAKPLTFMNESGRAVQALLHFYKLTPNDLIVVHDDKDIPLGETRVQVGRGAAGHNGVKSIIEQIGTKDFTRIRVGVAPTDKTIVDTADFVLGKFTKEEQKILGTVIDTVINELKKLVV